MSTELFEMMMKFALIIFALALALYIATSIFLSKLNKLMYGKGTPMAWIPVFNIYLLGKLTVNKAVGWILVICLFLTGSTTTTINDVETTTTILPKEISQILYQIYSVAVFGLFIYAIIKYIKLKKAASVQSQAPEVVQNPVQSQTLETNINPVQNINTTSIQNTDPNNPQQ